MPSRPPDSRQPLETPPVVGRGTLSFGLLGGGIAWMLHLLLAYLISEFGCLSGLGEVHLANISAVAWLLAAMTVAVLGLAAAATLVSWRALRRLNQPATLAGEAGRTQHFSARLGLITNVVFDFVIVVQSVPIFYFLRSC